MRCPFWTILSLCLLPALLCGCVQRTLTIESDPPGALVYLNNEEVGRTPMTRDFVHYGHYEVHLRKEGYRTLKTSARVRAPIWQWVPLDLLAELSPIPLRDHQRFSYTLEPMDPGPVEPDAILKRAAELSGELE